MEEIFVSHGNLDIIASHLKQILANRLEESKTAAKDIKSIQSQNNYTNIVLQSMYSQLSKIEANSDSKVSSSEPNEKKPLIFKTLIQN